MVLVSLQWRLDGTQSPVKLSEVRKSSQPEPLCSAVDHWALVKLCVSVTWLFRLSAVPLSALSWGFKAVAGTADTPNKRQSPLFTPAYHLGLVVTFYLISPRMQHLLLQSVLPLGRKMCIYLSLLIFNPDFSACCCLSCVFLQDVVVASGFTVGKSPTVHKDKLHPCNLLLSGDDANIYVRTFIDFCCFHWEGEFVLTVLHILKVESLHDTFYLVKYEVAVERLVKQMSLKRRVERQDIKTMKHWSHTGAAAQQMFCHGDW